MKRNSLNGTSKENSPRGHRRGSVVLSREAAEHLRHALEQMDLLLRTAHPETALPHLIFLLQRLRELRKATRL